MSKPSTPKIMTLLQKSETKRVSSSLFDVVKRLNPFINSTKVKVKPDMKLSLNMDEEAKEEE